MHANSYQDQSLCKFLHFWKVDNILALICCIIPTILETDGCSGVDRGFFDSGFSSPLPAWNYSWFAPLGLLSFLFMVSLTVLYQRSFQYAITDKRIHIRQSFPVLRNQPMGFPTTKWRILRQIQQYWEDLGFGNIHVVTGSGVGLQVESLGTSAGVEPEIIQSRGEDEIFLIPSWLDNFAER